MLTLNDGRSELWQWDTKRKLTVDADCSQVHFSNKVFGRSIDVDVIDGVATIPDILLQTDKELTAWAFVGTHENGYTKISKVFKVNRRNKPSDYVFTPPEQTTLGEILERLDDLEATQGPDAIKNVVDDYLANNPIKVEEADPTVPEWAKQPTPPDVKIPDKLPNPYSITFTGAANASYDGSNPVEIKIPDSGVNVDLDTTLTQSGKAADAKAVGDAINQLSEEITNKATEDSAPLGDELISASGWTLGAGWSGNLSSGFTHSSGVETLTFAMPEETAGNCYQVSFKSSEKMTDTNFFLSVGNSPLFNLYFEEHADGTISVGVLAAENGNLVFTPATDYKGTITEVSVKRITGTYPALSKYLDTNGNASMELRVSPAEQDNVFAGINAGQRNTTGNRNVALGANALRDNLSGWRNIAIGSNALAENTSGTRNTAIGENAMPKMQSGQRNIAIGTSTMELIVNGNRNIAIGADSMFNSEDCDDCVAIGFAALNNNSGNTNFGIGTKALYNASGNNNVAIGYTAGYGITSGWDNVAIGAGSVYNLKTGKNNVGIGTYALKGASNSDQSNYNVAIGYGAAQNIGRYSGNNVVIGANAAASLSGADYCIVIGAGQDVDASENHQLNIGGLLTGSLATGAAYLTVNGGLVLPNIPTSDPGVAGQVWNDNGTLKISAG